MFKSGVFIKTDVDLDSLLTRSVNIETDTDTNIVDSAALGSAPVVNNFQQVSRRETSKTQPTTNDNGTTSLDLIATMPAAFLALGVPAGGYLKFLPPVLSNTVPYAPSTADYITSDGSIRITTPGRFFIRIQFSCMLRNSSLGSTADVPFQVYASSDGAAAVLIQFVPGRSIDESGLGGPYGNDPTVQTIVRDVNVSEEIIIRYDGSSIGEIEVGFQHSLSIIQI